MGTISRAVAAGVILAACGGGGGDEGPRPAAPVITGEPADVTAVEGDFVEFEVAFTGEVTSVRWLRDGVDLVEGELVDFAEGQDASGPIAVLDLFSVPAGWTGSSVKAVLTGPGGTVTSREAYLVVEPAALRIYRATFEGGGVPPELDPGPAPAAVVPVEGFAGLGPAGFTFEGSFLRCPTGNPVTLTLDGLPEHTSLELDLLFAAIDSLDGTGTFPSGDYFRVDVDGVTVFRESFANATDQQEQSYVPPPGVELARKVDLGFQGPGGYYRDSAYDLGADPALDGIPHTAPSVTVVFELEGPGVQPLTDESWALDDLRVTLRR